MAAVLHGIHDLRFEQAPPLPDRPPPGTARIAIKAVGICRSDVYYLERGRIGPFVLEAPMVIGHETAGTVAEVGEGVRGLSVGDRVALEPGIPCWCNRLAKEGRYNLDPDIKFFATPPHHGSLAEYVDHPADFCFRLPDHVSHEEGAMCEPLSVGVHACRRAGVTPGKRVAILGAGPIGLVNLLAAKAFGATSIAVTDMLDANLQLASRMGATTTLRVDPGAPPEQAAASLKAAFGGSEGPDIVIDCAGFEGTMQTAIAACEPGGRIVLVGMGQDNMTLPMALASIREIDIYGSFRYCNTYPLCVSLLESGAVDVKPMITHRFGFGAEQIAAGFDCAVRSRETGAVKVMFNLD